MKQFSLYLALGFTLSFNLFVNAQTAGFNTTYAVLSINGGSNSYFDLQAVTANPDFNGADLGNFIGSNTLVLKGAEHNVYKCGGCDLSSSRLNYRIYKTGTTPLSFSNLNIGYSSGFSNGCGGEDQQWSNTGYSINLLSGLSAGNYTVEVYSDATVSCIGGTVYAGNFGANYKATFNYCGSLSGALAPGNYSIPGCFASVAAAAAYLNTNGVSGTGIIQFDVAAGYTETAPSSGIVLNGVGTAGNLATGTATTQIIFKKNGSGLNPKITAPLWVAGADADGIIKISGGDYITFDGFTLEENPLNTDLSPVTNTMTEVGFGLFTGSVSNGAQNNTIKNCTISLNQNFPNSIGIFSSSSSAANGTSLAATSSSGTNSFNKFYTNIISNVAYGFYLICPPNTSTLFESGNEFGGATSGLGNSITFGNATTSTASWSRFAGNHIAGIVYRNGTDYIAYNNTITSNSLDYEQTLCGGILSSLNINPNTVTYTTDLSNNNISIFNNGDASSIGVDFGYGIATATHIANNNIISINEGATTDHTAVAEGIKAQYLCSAVNISGNNISINQSGVGPFSGAVRFINANSNKNDVTIQSNQLQTVGGLAKTSSIVYGIAIDGLKTGNLLVGGSALTGNIINLSRSTPNINFVHGIYGANSLSTPTSFNVSYNNIILSNLTGGTFAMGIYNHEGNSSSVKTINNNTISISGTHSGVSNGMFLSNGIFTVLNNNINVSTSGYGVAGIDFTINGIVNQALVSNNSIALSTDGIDPILRGIGTSVTSVTNGFTITNNTIESISATATSGSPAVFGIRNGIGANNIISGNIIKNLSSASGSGDSVITGIDVSAKSINPTISNNKIYNLESLNSGVNSVMSGISSTNGTSTFIPTTVTIFNNSISDLRTPNSNSLSAINGILCFGTGFNYKVYYNTIKIGTASPIVGGTNFAVRGVAMNLNTSSTGLDLRNNIININATPSGIGYAACVSIINGTANNAPLGFQTTSNSNIYYINSNANNYLFVQGLDKNSVKNGFSVSGLIQNVSNNIINDTNFNASCGYYKTFMGGTLDANTFTENNLSNVGTGLFSPTGTSFAENRAVAISSPSITTDLIGVSRTPTNDSGALQFSGTSITYANPVLEATVSITASPAGEVPYLTSVTYTAVSTNGGTVPSYQWYVNNIAVSGETNLTFTTSTLEDYDVVTIKMISNNNCVAIQNVTSNQIIVNVIYPYDTNVINSQCGITLNTINQYIYANNISGAQAYRFKVTDLVTNAVQIIDKTLRVFQITQLPVYAFDRTYKIEVVTKRNGVWLHYGNPCNISTPATTTSLVNCGSTISSMNESIYAIYVPYAIGYRFKVTNTLTSAIEILDNPLREVRLSQLVSPEFNTLYAIQVAVQNTDGTFLPYGPICNIQSPTFPLTQLISSQCNSTLTLSSVSIYADNFTNATTYRFKIENASLSFSTTFDKPLRTFILNQVPGLMPGNVYSVTVSIEVGGVFGPYGPVCTLNLTGTARQLNEKKSFTVVAYPNPYSDSFQLNLNSSSDNLVTVKVYDMIGKLIDSNVINADAVSKITLGNNYPSGIYNVVVSQGENLETLRIIKR